jgi:hypothetical protein
MQEHNQFDLTGICQAKPFMTRKTKHLYRQKRRKFRMMRMLSKKKSKWILRRSHFTGLELALALALAESRTQNPHRSTQSAAEITHVLVGHNSLLGSIML